MVPSRARFAGIALKPSRRLPVSVTFLQLSFRVDFMTVDIIFASGGICLET